MSTKLKITVTKEILKRSSYCGIGEDALDINICESIQTNCAIALAVRDIWPKARVDYDYIYPFGKEGVATMIALPKKISNWINRFDDATPRGRERMKPFSFDVEIPDKVIKKINIDEIRALLQNHSTLELISQ